MKKQNLKVIAIALLMSSFIPLSLKAENNLPDKQARVARKDPVIMNKVSSRTPKPPAKDAKPPFKEDKFLEWRNKELERCEISKRKCVQRIAKYAIRTFGAENVSMDDFVVKKSQPESDNNNTWAPRPQTPQSGQVIRNQPRVNTRPAPVTRNQPTENLRREPVIRNQPRINSGPAPALDNTRPQPRTIAPSVSEPSSSDSEEELEDLFFLP